MTGTGLVNLPGQTLDLRLAPRATTTIDGQGGQALAIPVRVTGTFSQPRLSIDAEALLRGRLEGGLQDFLNKALKPGEGSQAPGGTGGSTGGSGAPGADPGRQLLEGIFGPAPQQGAPGGAAPGGQAPGGETPGGAATPIEETLIKQGIGRLLGGREPAPGTDAPSAETAEEEPQP
jgi:AsmA protein